MDEAVDLDLGTDEGEEGTLIGKKELKASYRELLGGDLTDVHTLQFAQWQATALGYPLPKRKCLDGGRPLTALAYYIIRTSNPKLIPPSQGTSTLLGRKKP